MSISLAMCSCDLLPKITRIIGRSVRPSSRGTTIRGVGFSFALTRDGHNNQLFFAVATPTPLDTGQIPM